MKISELKQPYRRMAEYYRIVERSELTGRIEIYIPNEFPEPEFNHWFWTEIKKGNNPPITEEIKKHFPADFDFSGEEVKTKPVMQMLDAETQKYIYTQLAKDGKFDELPDTCEFSEPVELEVSDFDTFFKKVNVVGKFKSKFVEKEDISTVGYIMWNYAQLPTPKIDFSEFKNGDVVEVVVKGNEKIYGLLFKQNIEEIFITFSYQSYKTICIKRDYINSITKLK